MAPGRQRRIERPSGSSPAGAGLTCHEQRHQQEGDRGRQQPERDIVHARERHVGRPDHQRHHPIAEAPDQGRHHHEKDHDEAVRRGEHIVGVRIGKDLQAGLLQLHPHADRQRAPDDPRQQGEDEVHRADVLVIGGIEIAAPSDRMIAGVVRLLSDAGSCHGPSLSWWDVAPLSSVRCRRPRLYSRRGCSSRAGSIS